MNKTLKSILALAVMSPLLSAAAFAGSRTVYGRDDRVELFEASWQERQLADSVVSMWESKNVLEDRRTGSFSLNTMNIGETLALCPGERFREQGIGAFCTGALVGEDLIMTAGHCVPAQAACDGMKIVFGYAIAAPGASAPASIGAADVYSCKRILTRAETNNGPDYALIRLDRKVSGRRPLGINRTGNLKEGSKVLVIGHPIGLPLKIAGSAAVRYVSPRGYFVTDLDTFGGNSGSPVFNAATGLIEGILVRGGRDFVTAPEGCTTLGVNSQTGGRGEDVTSISVLGSYIP